MGRFAYVVDTLEGIEDFKTQYQILSRVSIRYCKQGEWQAMRQEGEVVIPMIAFIEGGMRIAMGRVTRDYLIAHRLSPTQCTPNMFRILGSVDALNEKMGLNLTHHDVNWIYNLHLLKRQGYYLKTRVPEVRLILCLPDSNKGMNKDFLIISGEWHDGLHCLTRDGIPGGVLRSRLITLMSPPFSLILFVFFFFLLVCAIWTFPWIMSFFW